MEYVRLEDAANYWSESSGKQVDRDIFAHMDCLQRYYTPPSELECPDCGLRLASRDLGFTALRLWSASRDELQGVTCPRCGKLCYFFHTSIRCNASSEPNSTYPCMKPLYSFQVGPHGHGHGPVPTKVIDNTDKKGGCFIATAVLKGEHAAQLAALYNFRDHFLMSSAFGRRCVRAYYRLSPPLAASLEESIFAKVIVRQCFVLPTARLVKAVFFHSRNAE